MITFNYELDFEIENEAVLESWISSIIKSHNCELGEVNYIFCNDEYLHKLNLEFLKHDTLTDIISFDNSLGKLINGDIYISVERVLENAEEYKVSFQEELKRVMIHGVLHYCGFKDKTEKDQEEMTKQENLALSSFK
ncbi:rRNA maturation RNase YbeY [uncultured Polaribacter sp.]|uniref:rRNA maturation RNase YbeY n=1 Tax=uncultured Polaribacter sp. TaxID=174711 RepID=UPI0026094603|nr:rRNA maturation RNase YbeY [uncultured Polaribacter sp.]